MILNCLILTEAMLKEKRGITTLCREIPAGVTQAETTTIKNNQLHLPWAGLQSSYKCQGHEAAQLCTHTEKTFTKNNTTMVSCCATPPEGVFRL